MPSKLKCLITIHVAIAHEAPTDTDRNMVGSE